MKRKGAGAFLWTESSDHLHIRPLIARVSVGPTGWWRTAVEAYGTTRFLLGVTIRNYVEFNKLRSASLNQPHYPARPE